MNKITQLAGLGLILVFLSVSIASAQLGVPHQFFGDVITNGVPAFDGLSVMAKIDGQDVANTTTLNGAYGLLPGNIFYIEDDPLGDRYGETIEFFVQDIKAGEYVFSNGESTELDLSVTGDLGVCGDSFCGSGEDCSSCSQDCGSCPPSSPPSTGGGGGGGGGGSYTPPCYENWTCSAWSICSQEGIQIRICNDGNSCGTVKERPEQERTCVYTPQEKPSICSAGSRVCSGNNVVECSAEGRQWNIVEECGYGCSDAKCNPEPGETGEGAAAGAGETSAPGGGLAGYLIANPAVMFFGALVIIIIALVGAIYWKARPGQAAKGAEAPKPHNNGS